MVGKVGGTIGLEDCIHPLGRRHRSDIYRSPIRGSNASARFDGAGRRIRRSGSKSWADRWQTFWRVIFPSVLPSLLTGFALAFARALGEYGSVVFISGNMPMKTEITSLLIITKLEQYDYAGATAIAVVMLSVSFLILLSINGIQWWFGRSLRKGF